MIHPLRRVGPKGSGEFERIGWDEAIEAAAAGLRSARERHGPESVLPYYFAGTEGMVQGWIMGPRLFAAMGASGLRTTICTAAADAALRATYGGSVGTDPEAFEYARLIILWGANLLSTNLHQWRFVLAAQQRGAHVVAIDPLRTDTAERCDEHIAPRPGTDAALALGLMRTVLDEGAEDREWLARHSEGWPELEARLAEWPVERAAEVCGLPSEVVRALGRRLAHTRPTAIRLGLGLQRHGGAGAAMRAVLAIPALTGDFRHVGGGALCMTGGHYGGIKSGRVAVPADLPTPPARIVNMSRLGEALMELDDPPVAALVVFDANPAASNPDHARVHEGLAREDLFTVVLEQRMTDTALDSPTSCCRRRCSRSTSTCTTPTGSTTSRSTSRPSSRPASASPTARSSAGSPAPSASITRACRSPTSRWCATCSTATRPAPPRSRSSGCATRARCA